jgi:hypothetical protein
MMSKKYFEFGAGFCQAEKRRFGYYDPGYCGAPPILTMIYATRTRRGLHSERSGSADLVV